MVWLDPARNFLAGFFVLHTMAIASFTTDYADLDQIPAYAPAFITCTANGTAVEVVRMQVREATTGSYTQIAQLTRQPDLGTTGNFTFNFVGIAEDRLSANDDPLGYGYPNGVCTNEWKRYQFLFDELSRNANDQLVVTDNDKGWDGATSVVEEGFGTLGIHYWTPFDEANQYYINDRGGYRFGVVADYGFNDNATPSVNGTANQGIFMTDITGVTISEPWSFTLDYVIASSVTSVNAAYRHTFSAVVYDRTVALTAASLAFERQRLQCGLKDLEDNSDFATVVQIFQGYLAGDDDGYQVLLKSGATAITRPYDVKLIDSDGCRKVGLEWVNPYGAVDFMEFRMKGDDYFLTEEGETWEKSDYESFSDVYSTANQTKYPQQLRRQQRGRYSLELQSHSLPVDYGHLILKQIALAPKAWIQIQLGNGGFAKNDESFTESNITDRIPVVLEIDEEVALTDRKGQGSITINLRANFSRSQVGQRT